MQTLTRSWYSPVTNVVKFTFCGTVSIVSQIATDEFNSFLWETTLIQPETNPIFLENIYNTFKVQEDRLNIITPDQNIVND